jgi:hypothetical protein
MRLLDTTLGKLCAYILDYGNRPGNANDVTEAVKAYHRAVQDISRGAGAQSSARNEFVEKFGQDRAARIG